MIKIRSMEQAQAVSLALDTEAGADGGVDLSQRNDDTVVVSRLTKSGKVESYTAVQTDGSARTRHAKDEDPYWRDDDAT